LPVAHTRILRLDTQNAILSNQYNNVDLSTEIADMDLMTQFVPCPSTPAACTTNDNGTKFGLFVDARTNLTIYHGVLDANGAWVSNTVDAIAAVQPDPAIWHRVTVTFDATATRPSGGAIEMFQVQIDNAPVSAPAGAYDASWRTNWIAGQPVQPATGGTWWPSATTNANRKKLTAIAFQGTGGVDDLLVTQSASNAVPGEESTGASPPIQQAQDWQKTQSWNLEPAGNWSQFRDATNVQTRTHNRFNEITAINGLTNAVTHDPAGNITRSPLPLGEGQGEGLLCKYDPWNRLTSIQSGAGVPPAVLANYTYDADWKRIKKTLADNSSQDYYYDDMQLAEIRQYGQSGQPTQTEQYVYDTRYLHSVACRDLLASSGDLLTRHYLLNDANFNVTALVSTNNTVVERYTYDPYGAVTIRDASWQPITWDSSTKNIILYTGHKFDSETGFYYSLYRYYHPILGRWLTRDPLMETRDNLALRGVSGKMLLERHTDGYGYRFYSPGLGRWVNRDPIGKRGDRNTYCALNNNSITLIDSLGLKTKIKGYEDRGSPRRPLVSRYANSDPEGTMAPVESAGSVLDAVYEIDYTILYARGTVVYRDCDCKLNTISTAMRYSKSILVPEDTPFIVPVADMGAFSVDPGSLRSLKDSIFGLLGGILADLTAGQLAFVNELRSERQSSLRRMIHDSIPDSLNAFELVDIEFVACP
jgi:RHS repeat-associated protein